MPISPEDTRPLTLQIADDLRERIAKGEFPPGGRFPSLKKLAPEYGVAELTVHNAVRELQRDGLLISVGGKGTFVRDADSSATPTNAAILEELLAVRSELAELRDELTRRVEALEHPPEGADR